MSPHLDDAVLALGGAIATWDDATIATVYTQGPVLDEIAPELRKWGDYATRLPEDVAACEAVGASRVWLGHVERVWRGPLARMGFFTLPDDRAGLPLLPAIAASLDALGAFDEVYVPLGVGNHVDHVETMLAAVEWGQARGLALRFYEDFYALAWQLRAAHPVARRWTWPPERSPVTGALAASFAAIDAARRGPPLERLWPALAETAPWSVEPIACDEDRWLAAVACYGSQTAAFGGMPGIAAALRGYRALWSGVPIWQPGGSA